MSNSFRITLVEPTTIDEAGFVARRKGFEVRDCLLVLQPGNKRRLCLVTKSDEASATTFVENYVRTGKGVFDIDASRISANSWYFSEEDSEWFPTTGKSCGRYPSNVILYHSPRCQTEDDLGQCVADCPVHMLDTQSGELHVQDPRNRAFNKSPKKDKSRLGFGTAIGIEYLDGGGASRFFKKVGNEGELEMYIKHLVRDKRL